MCGGRKVHFYFYFDTPGQTDNFKEPDRRDIKIIQIIKISNFVWSHPYKNRTNNGHFIRHTHLGQTTWPSLFSPIFRVLRTSYLPFPAEFRPHFLLTTLLDQWVYNKLFYG